MKKERKYNKLELKDKIKSFYEQNKYIFTITLFFVFQCFFLYPLNFTLNNIDELCISINLFTVSCFCVSLIIFTLFISAFLFFNPKIKNIICTILFIIAIHISVKISVLFPFIGKFEGIDFQIEKFLILTILELVLFILLIVLIKIFYNKKLYLRVISILSLMLLLTSSAQIAFDYTIQSKQVKNTQIYGVDYSKYNVYSKNKNIILIILDNYGNICFQNYKKINPKFYNDLHDFDYYPNFLSPTPVTAYAIPSMLTGKSFKENNKTLNFNNKDKEFIIEGLNSENSTLNILKRQGFINHVYFWKPFSFVANTSYLDNLYTSNNFNEYSMHRFERFYKNYLAMEFIPFIFNKPAYKYFNMLSTQPYSLSSKRFYSDLDFINYTKQKPIIVSEPVFKLYHLRGLHPPFVLDENFNEVEHLNRKDPLLTTADIYAKLLKNYIEYLKNNNIYDNSAIIILGDHGSKIKLSETLHKDEIAINPVLLVKGYNQHYAEIKKNEISPETADILKIISYFSGYTNEPWKGLTPDMQLKHKQILKNKTVSYITDLENKYKTVGLGSPILPNKQKIVCSATLQNSKEHKDYFLYSKKSIISFYVKELLNTN